MNASQVKKILFSLGADLCGIASLDRFDSAPKGYHPTDVFPMCKSVISFACRFPVSTLACNSHAPYTVARNGMTAKMDAIALSFCTEMEKQGVLCVPIPTNDSQWDEAAGRWRSIVSQKHAAQAAGLGTIGRHSLLITPEFGSMVWLGCVLCSLALEPDGMKEPVCTDCGLCAASCPAHALDDGQVNQQACWDHAFGEDKVLKTWVISCHRCRDVCPYNFGTENENLLPRARTMSAPFDVSDIRLETPRLILRPVAMEDLTDFHEYASDPEVTNSSGWKAHETIGESREHLEHIVSSNDCLALVLKENGKMVGNIALQIRDWSKYPLKSTLRGREYGFELNRAYWGRGLMPEAVMAVTEYCFQTLRYDFVTGGHFAENGKSARVIQKCGFTFLFDGSETMPTGRTEQIRTYIRYNPYKGGTEMIAPIDVTNIRIETDRLILRPWEERDAEDFYEYARVDGVGQMAGWLPHESMEKTREILNMFIQEKKVLALERKETGKVIGSLGIEAGREHPEIPEKMKGREIGYVLSKTYWGRGLMPEAVNAVLDYCFRELHYDYLKCGHFERNHQSRRVIEKCGFHYYKDILHETRFGTQEPTKMYIKFCPRMSELNELEQQMEGAVMETDRLILRNFEDRDAEDCFDFLSDRENCYLDGGYEPFTGKDGEYWWLMEKMKGQKSRFMLWHKEDQRVIGTLNLMHVNYRAVKTVEIGYCVSPAYYRQGYASEAIRKAISYLFENTQVELITASAAAHNTASLAMLEKLGFTCEGAIRKGFSTPDRGVCDLKSYYLEK